MTKIRHQIDAACPPERVWAVLADLESVQHYNPGVRAAALRGSLRRGVGAMRSCDLLPKGQVVERVTEWDEGRALGLEVAESDWPIHFMRWVTRLEPHGAGTRITQVLEYQPKFGPFGWLLNQIVMKRKLQAAIGEVFTGLARYAERGVAR
ncbi:MAG TPA: SRPBCC family protein [Vicinamibacterales bacterium]|nr:SRPBCC family protein [Vicinamibacterales bacterium]